VLLIASECSSGQRFFRFCEPLFWKPLSKQRENPFFSMPFPVLFPFEPKNAWRLEFRFFFRISNDSVTVSVLVFFIRSKKRRIWLKSVFVANCCYGKAGSRQKNGFAGIGGGFSLFVQRLGAALEPKKRPGAIESVLEKNPSSCFSIREGKRAVGLLFARPVRWQRTTELELRSFAFCPKSRGLESVPNRCGCW